ncbi:hypothetical protein F2Q70_00020377 [Brassica cretica]|uniref:Uncharacterized protein n=1 Tax=Brassica cretica TaxID=69181 RepID=A0A8S9GU30_BRACR|nr:hypothetical protein F2Q70_00020377 [Brassica cretica]
MSLSGVEATVVTWNTLAGVLLQTGEYVKALSFVAKMRNHNVSLDSVAMINGLKACSQIGALRWGREFHCLAIRSCYARIENVGNSLITMYSRCGDLNHAFIVFQQMGANGLSTWNSIVSGYAHNERSEETCFLLREVMLAGFHPNHVTLASVLALCARVGSLQHGRELHCYILRRQSCFNDGLILWNSLVDMYSKSGKMGAAKRVFESMSKRDRVTYTSLIDGYGMLGEGEVALAWFKEMIRSGMEPDHVTMVAVLSACSHSDLVGEGERQFKKMQYVFGIHPRLEHYSCMVDLYCRAGLLVNARDYMNTLNYLTNETFSSIPSDLVSDLQRMLSTNESFRPTALDFTGSNFFRSDTRLRALRFLDHMLERDNMQKSEFLKALSDMWKDFDSRVLRYKVLPPLCAELRNLVMQPVILPMVLTIAESQDKNDFELTTLPALVPVLSSATGDTLLLLVKRADLIINKTNTEHLASHILPLLLRAYNDNDVRIQEEVLKRSTSVAKQLDGQRDSFSIVRSIIGKVVQINSDVIMRCITV